MKLLVAILAVLALVGSAMAWDMTDSLTYSNTKTFYQQGGDNFILPQVAGLESGAYFTEPNDAYGSAFAELENTLPALTGITVTRTQTNPVEDATAADFYLTAKQGGSAVLSTHSMNSADAATLAAAGQKWTPEISGSAVAGQSLTGTGQLSVLDVKNMDSEAQVGFAAVSQVAANTPVGTGYNVFTALMSNNEAKVDSLKHGAGMMNTATVGESVTAAYSQDFIGSGWLEPTYSGGIDMYANFAGACDPHCSNPILSTVSGTAATALFPSDVQRLTQGSNGAYGAGNVGDVAYWGTNWATEPEPTQPIGTNPGTPVGAWPWN